MKKKFILIPALLLVGMCGCDGNNNTSIIPDSQTSTSESDENWSNEVKDIMNEYLKVILPYHQFEEATFDYEVSAEEGIIALFDKSTNNHIADYKNDLISKGWVLEQEVDVEAYANYEEDSEGNISNLTDKFTFHETILINQTNNVVVAYTFSENDGIYDGDDGYYYEINKGNQLVAYNSSNSNQGELTSWPEELITYYFDATVPAVEGVDSYYVDDSSMDEYGLVISFESTDTTLEASYKQTLLNASFTVEYDEEWGGDLAVDSEQKVIVGWYLSEGEFIIQIFANGDDSGDNEVLSSWPTEEIKAIFNVDVPS